GRARSIDDNGDASHQDNAEDEEEERVQEAAFVLAGVENLREEEDEAADQPHDERRADSRHDVVGKLWRFAGGGHTGRLAGRRIEMQRMPSGYRSIPRRGRGSVTAPLP